MPSELVEGPIRCGGAVAAIPLSPLAGSLAVGSHGWQGAGSQTPRCPSGAGLRVRDTGGDSRL